MSNALMIGNAAMAGYNAYNMFSKPTMNAPGGGGSGQGSMGGYGGISGGSQYGKAAFSNNLSGNLSGNLSNNKVADQLGLFNTNISLF